MSEREQDQFERHFAEVAAIVPDEGEVAVLTRAELLSAMSLAWACGQAQLAACMLTDPQAVFSAVASVAMNGVMHGEMVQRVSDACAEGARSVGVRTRNVACNGGRDEEDEVDE